MGKNAPQKFLFGILVSLSLVHGLNDTMQSIISSSYPLLKESLKLSYSEIGMVALTFQISSSLMQPLFGYIFDKRGSGWFLPFGLVCTMCGLVLISFAPSVYWLMASVFISGMGSAVIHPEASKITSFAAGGRRGLAQSIFQVGGSCGFAMGPLLAALFVREQTGLAKFAVLAGAAFVAMLPACRWYSARLREKNAAEKSGAQSPFSIQCDVPILPVRTIIITISILIFLVFSKNFYTVSISNYYTFYLMTKFGVSLQTSQTMLFAFLFSAAVGTLVGGPVGDKLGRRLVIWWSILGSAPFALMMPYANLAWTVALSMIIGFIISSAFAAILVYAQELLPMKVGMVSGIFFGFAFGMAGVSSAILGRVADSMGIEFVYELCSFFPLFGAVAYFLPRVRTLQSMKNTVV